jgi:hypothetical protein
MQLSRIVLVLVQVVALARASHAELATDTSACSGGAGTGVPLRNDQETASKSVAMRATRTTCDRGGACSDDGASSMPHSRLLSRPLDTLQHIVKSLAPTTTTWTDAGNQHDYRAGNRHQKQQQQQQQQEKERGVVCFDVSDRTAEFSPAANHVNDVGVTLCVDMSIDNFWGESTWVSVPRDSGVPMVSPAIRFPATLRVVGPRLHTMSGGAESTLERRGKDTSHHNRGVLLPADGSHGYSCAVHVIASLGHHSSDGGGVRVNDAVLTAVWAGSSKAVARLALPGWLSSRSSRLQGDGAWCDASNTAPAIVVTVPSRAVPPSLLYLSDALNRYDMAVGGAVATAAGTR